MQYNLECYMIYFIYRSMIFITCVTTLIIRTQNRSSTCKTPWIITPLWKWSSPNPSPW